MQRLRIGPLDIVAAIVVLVVLLLPDRELEVESAYARVEDDERPALLAKLAVGQAALSRDPGDGAAVQALTEALVGRKVGQHDQALRIAGEAAARAESPTRWRSLLALSWAHAERVDIPAAHAVALEAMTACEATPTTCPGYERVRLGFYVDELTAAVEVIAQGFDPRTDPAGFRAEVAKHTGLRSGRRLR